MDARKRAGGATISGAWIVGFGRELLTLPPGKTIDMLGDIISPQSFYLALTVLGLGGLAYFGWPAAQWAWQMPSRREAREQKKRASKKEEQLAKERRINKQVVDNLESLQSRLEAEMSGRSRNPIENRETVRILTNDLRAMGLELPEIEGEANYQRLHHRVSRLLPCVRLYGVKKVLSDMGE